MNTPLKNKLFISTRPKGQSDELNRLLELSGAKIIEMPLIKIRRAELNAQENKLIDELKKYDWLIFTSSNGIRCFFETLKEREIFHLPKNLQIAVIGEKTKKILSSYGYSAAFINPGDTSEDFVESFIQKIKNNSHPPQILLALGNLARTVIQDKLGNFAECTRVNVYETIHPDSVDEETIQLIKNNRYTMLIFTSPSAIQNFMKLIHNIPAENIRLACIGETTASEARKQGIQPLVVAKNASAQGIVDAIIQYYS